MQETSVTGMPLPHEDEDGTPIPVTIPVPLGSRTHAVFTTRLGGISEGLFASLNLGGRAGDSEGGCSKQSRSFTKSFAS